MPEIVGVRFKRAGKVYYFDPTGTALKVYDYVVVQTARGTELGQVTIAPKQVLATEITAELKSIVRKASTEDVKRAQDFTSKEDNALTECVKMITKMNLPMKMVSAEYNLDGSRLTFYFTAEERVDFRELVRELTAFFKTRIELRQIGPRDQAKMVGGLGRCGRALCCGSFLSEFNPVSIKMAKEQDLPLDPMKISGVCGRLQCCLAYESSQYREIKAQMPKKGQQVTTPEGTGFVIGLLPLKDSVLVEMESKASVEFPVDQIKVTGGVSQSPGPESESSKNEEPGAVITADSPKPQPETRQPVAPAPKAGPEPSPELGNEPPEVTNSKEEPQPLPQVQSETKPANEENK
jgi:cell fate regulator YaaT (PSP1 superfamily)